MAVGRGRPANVKAEVIEVVTEVVTEVDTEIVADNIQKDISIPVVDSDTVVKNVPPYAEHEYHNISNEYLTYLREKISLSLFGEIEDSLRARHMSFLDAATAIMEYRVSNGIVIK